MGMGSAMCECKCKGKGEGAAACIHAYVFAHVLQLHMRQSIRLNPAERHHVRMQDRQPEWVHRIVAVLQAQAWAKHYTCQKQWGPGLQLSYHQCNLASRSQPELDRL